MKRLFIILALLMIAVASFVGCDEERIIYSGPSYVAFADTLSVYPVQEDCKPLQVAIAATRSCDYDRTFGVEVINQGSNAVYGRHYTLESQSVTIKAGEQSTTVNVVGNYANIEPTDSLGFTLRLVMPEEAEWDLYGIETKVRLQKSCPFHIEDFTGYCLVSSSFLMNYANTTSRLIRSEIVEGKENTVLLRGVYYDGFDIEVAFDPDDPLNPVFKLAEQEQVIADTRLAFSYIYGNGHLLVSDLQGMPNNFNSCQRYALQYVTVRVDGMSDEEIAQMGSDTVGTFVNIFEWLTDEEAEEYK